MIHVAMIHLMVRCATIGLLVALARCPSVWRVPLPHHRPSMGKEVLTKAGPVGALVLQLNLA
jgi:hypothetical protein